MSHLETLTDPALWGRARNGEKGSFEELMRRYGRLAELKEVLRQLRPNVTW